MKCSDTEYNSSPWEWRPLGVADPGSGGPGSGEFWEWRAVTVLRWLPIRQRIEYRVASLGWRCQLGLTPIYPIDLCRYGLGIASCHSLGSAGRGSQSRLLVPLPCKPGLFVLMTHELRLLSRTISDTFYNHLKTEEAL